MLIEGTDRTDKNIDFLLIIMSRELPKPGILKVDTVCLVIFLQDNQSSDKVSYLNTCLQNTICKLLLPVIITVPESNVKRLHFLNALFLVPHGSFDLNVNNASCGCSATFTNRLNDSRYQCHIVPVHNKQLVHNNSPFYL